MNNTEKEYERIEKIIHEEITGENITKNLHMNPAWINDLVADIMHGIKGIK